MRGLRAAPRSWQERLAHLMRRDGFARLQSEASVCANLMFVAIALVYVDGLVAVGSQSSPLQNIKRVSLSLLLHQTRGLAEEDMEASFIGSVFLRERGSVDARP